MTNEERAREAATPPMSEIEKAREFLDSRWNKHIGGLFGQASEITQGIERLTRLIAREEIGAAKVAAGPEAGDLVTLAGCSPGVFITEDGKYYGLKTEYGMTIEEAPAAGDPKEMAGRLRNIARDPNNFIPRAGSLIEAAVMIEDTTALARRLAEALNKVWLSGEPEVHEREVESVLVEARKAGLIE